MQILPFALPHGQARNRHRACCRRPRLGDVARELAGLTGLAGWLAAVLCLAAMGAARLA